MTTIYQSSLVKKLSRNRGLYAGKTNDVAGRIFIPNGTVLAVGDILLGVPVGENLRLKETHIMVVGNLNGAAGSTGAFQILGRDGNPAVVYREGPIGAPPAQTFTSPASAPALYHAAQSLTGYISNFVITPARLAGPVNVGVIITTGATVSADTEVFIGCQFDGEMTTVIFNGTAAPSGTQNNYLL